MDVGVRRSWRVLSRWPCSPDVVSPTVPRSHPRARRPPLARPVARRPRRPYLTADGYVVIPRTNVALRPPDGFVVDASLPGLVRTDAHSSFHVVQAESPSDDDPAKVVDELAAGFEDEQATAQKGLRFDSVKRFSVDGRPAVGAVGTQTARGTEFNKAVVTFVSDGFFVSLSATLATDDPLSAADALAVLREARWSATAGEGGLGFAITPAKDYVKQESSAGLTYTLNGESGPGVALFLVSPSLGAQPIPPADRQEAARARFAALPGKPVADAEDRVTIAGLPGWEFTGTGKENGLARTYYATVLFTDDGYLVLAGTFDPAKYPDQIKAFKSMARSLELTDG